MTAGAVIAPRSTQCHCVVLLLDDGPEVERAPGLAPGKGGFAIRRLDGFGIARVVKWGDRRVLPPFGDLHRIECWLLHYGLRLKVIRLRVPPPSGLAYKESAWRPRMDLRHQPPESEPVALLFELRG
jgi:hypothetical protein